ncbi:hypothetical protein ACF07V_03785 [Streptomyces sp. NPDC015661]|uniref:hypothetical protein n=1 Tax=Streptomyces sp. NPDC015661 TaxID=3364961 RepID=UPI0036F5E108
MPLGVLAIAMGVAAFRTGWMIPPARRSVRQPRLYGFGAVLVGVGLLASVVTYYALHVGAVERDPWLAFIGNFLELIGMTQIAASRRSPRHARAPHRTA